MELLRGHSEGLIAMSACLAGEIPRLLQDGNYEAAKNKALEMREIFGDDSFYLELQDHGIAAQKEVNRGVIRISRETGIPLVVTNDVHYLTLSLIHILCCWEYPGHLPQSSLSFWPYPQCLAPRSLK